MWSLKKDHGYADPFFVLNKSEYACDDVWKLVELLYVEVLNVMHIIYDFCKYIWKRINEHISVI